MFDDTIKKIEKNIGNIEEFIGKDDEFIKPFQIWQGIMIKASETHNLPEFKNGLKEIFKVIEEKQEKSRNKQDQYVKDRRAKIVDCIEDVRQTCMTEKQYLFLNEFICKFESIYKNFIDKYDDTEYGSRGEIIKKFEEMICRTIDDNEYGYSEDYLNRLFKMYWDEKLSDNERYDLRNEMIFTVNNIVNYAIANKSKTTSIFINLINNKENNIPTVDNAMSNNDNFRRDTVKFNDPDQAALWPDFPKNPHRDNTKSWIIRVRWYITITRCLQRITLESISSGKLYELYTIFRVMEDLIEKYYESTYKIISTNPDLDENLHYALIKEFNKYIK
ncbi:MAG: hypothetical protein MPL62_18395, partial [Alphaproteobacteria bacterium]|nr:hypothetical protein [Alphaproteobacteria bacterium]